MSTNTKSKKTVRSEVYARFMHVQARKGGQEPLRAQVATDGGKVGLPKVNESIYKAVLGERRGDKGTQFTLGLRKLTGCKFRGHFDANDVMQGLDIVPNRYFLSGVAPVIASDARKKGFDIHFNEDINGYEVWTEDPKDGEKRRFAYAGMSENSLYELLDLMREAKWGDKKTMTLNNHKIERVDDITYRVKPTAEVSYTT